jgi:protein-disulfide isomerase
MKKIFKNYKTAIYFVLGIAAIALVGAREQLGGFFKGSSSKDEIKEVVREFINDNPDVIVNSVMKMQERKMQEMQQKTQEVVKENKAALESSDTQPFAGNKDAQFVVVQFFDYRCGHCKHSNKDLNKFLADYPDSKIVYRNLAILGPESVKAAQAALSVYKLYPASFKAFHDDLMSASVINDAELNKLFVKYNMDQAKINQEMQSEAIQKVLEENKELAMKLGMRGVPAYIINGEFTPGQVNYDVLKAKKESMGQKPAN